MKKEKNKKLESRSPIVAVLGHVDHGKTTLLDSIRKTTLVKKEAGGITQTIGASIGKTKDGKEITFIDTPGHKAFEEMRSRGATVADLAILVVAADDGVKPQTVEAIKHIKKAGIPYIVALTKIDLPSANTELVKGQLEKEGLLFEGRGGDIPVVSLSAKENKGIEELLEMIILVAEVNGVEGNEKEDLEAVVIETGKDRRGLLVACVVRKGMLRIANDIFVNEKKARVKAIFDWQDKSIKEIGAGKPALILGFSELPSVGEVIRNKKFIKLTDEKKEKGIKKLEKDEIALVVKAENAGSLEAILNGLPKEIVVIASGLGEVTKTDVFSAKAAKSPIFAFETKAQGKIKDLAKTEGVKIETFDIIYKLFERAEEIVSGGKREILGKAEIVASFPFDNKKVAGCKVVSGKIQRTDSLILIRKEEEVGEAKISSMRREKESINEAKEGEECGIVLSPQLDFERGDVLISVRN